MDVTSSILEVKGIGTKVAEKLKRASIFTVEDLLYTLPYRYEDGSDLRDFSHPDFDRSATYAIRLVEKMPRRYLKRGLSMQTYKISDGNREGEMTFFNMPYLDKSFQVGKGYYIYGKPKLFHNRLQFSTPKVFDEKKRQQALSIAPIYPLISGISQKAMGNYIQQALQAVQVRPVAPVYLRDRYGLFSEDKALRILHGPRSMEEAKIALQSLIFSEFLCFQLALGRFHRSMREDGFSMKKTDLAEAILRDFPFQLTKGQENAWCDIRRDMASDKRMERLVQGDVGSGKTIIAFLAMATCVASGYQALFMAPTEILAQQHYEEAFRLFMPQGVRVELLTGSTKEGRKKSIRENFANGNCDIVIGTHSLFSEQLSSERIGLTITDEQHRFGVMQREALQEKQSRSDRLIMTATPIPRSLAIVMYGDTAISSIRTMPKGRKRVETTVVNESGLTAVYNFMEDFLKSGQQIYVVCPLIEANPDLNLHAAETVYDYFSKERFKGYSVALIHGRLASEEKNKIMEAFQQNEIQILISTTVIEVGVNVVNANLLFVFDADRFGLATLHQLRGRVGRGNQKAYCILHSANNNLKSQERLNILVRSNDGFSIAEEDMKLRGGGDFFGTRQSGTARFRVGDLFENMDIMRYAKIEADAILEGNHLNETEEPELFQAVRAYESRTLGT
ncbi:MAG: ATP-dependent DNA helicase RecG [Peptoniphilus sp.]|nr:ATP-dependent DNA helicase RecG [Peptoniphilus sp.]MDY3119291.1 ATP-dependent DNA helicase RecG [Peptoniphilus sp.]